MAGELRLALLGGLHITLGGHPLTGFVSSKAQALLCYLAVSSRPHLRPELAGLLWGDMPEVGADTNLRKALSNLHGIVGPHLLIARQSVAFDRESDYWLDVEVFRAKLQSALSDKDDASLREAVALYHGDLLHGFHVREAPAFEEWLLLERERLSEQASQALYTLAAHYAARGEYAEGIDFTSRLLALEPWREEAHRQMMTLLARTGQRSAALAQYEAGRRSLARELGVEPSPETTALYERIRAALSASRHNLPVRTTPFIGRETELAEIARLLDRPDCRLLTLVGLGGIGKTRLALEAAEAKVDAFLNGAFFVSLAPLGSPDFLVPAIAEAIGCTLYGRTDPKTQLLSYLREKEMLLVLDSFEHLLDGADVLVEILRHAPCVKFLVTSRERLNLHAEWVFEVQGLSYPRGGRPRAGALEGYGAVRLFLQSAQRAHVGLAFTDEEKADAGRICQLVEGMPLGIELAAAQAHTIACRDIAREIERNRDFLATSLRDMPARHRSMRAVFDHSWALLSETERRVFRNLSAFRGGFQQSAAEQVAGATQASLSALANKSLLHHNAAGRHDMHEFLRQYAADKLAEAGEVEPVRNRHLDFVLRLAEEAGPNLYGADQLEWLEQLEAEHDNLRAALEWSLDSQRGPTQADVALRLANALGPFWIEHGYFGEGRMWLGRALVLASYSDAPSPTTPQARTQMRAMALYLAGILALHQSDFKQVTSLAEMGLAVSQEHGDAWGRAISLCLLGCATFNQGDYERAKALCNEGLALLGMPNSPEDRWIVAQAFNDLGDIEIAQGHYQPAAMAWGEALALYREMGDRRGTALSLNNQGYVAYRQGDYAPATASFEEAAALFRAVKDKVGLGNSLRLIGLTAQAHGDYARAKSLFEESQVLCRESGDRGGLVYSLWYLARLALAEGEVFEAQALCGQSLALAREIGSKAQIVWALHSLGIVACHQADFARARDLLTESLALAREIGDLDGIADALNGFAQLAADQRQPLQAARLFGAAEAFYDSMGASVPPSVRAEYHHIVAHARAQLDEAAFTAAWTEGRTLTPEQAVAEALGRSPSLRVDHARHEPVA